MLWFLVLNLRLFLHLSDKWGRAQPHSGLQCICTLGLHSRTTQSNSAASGAACPAVGSPSSPSQRRSFLHLSPSAEHTLAAVPDIPESADGTEAPPPHGHTPETHEPATEPLCSVCGCVYLYMCVYVPPLVQYQEFCQCEMTKTIRQSPLMLPHHNHRTSQWPARMHACIHTHTTNTHTPTQTNTDIHTALVVFYSSDLLAISDKKSCCCCCCCSWCFSRVRGSSALLSG